MTRTKSIGTSSARQPPDLEKPPHKVSERWGLYQLSLKVRVIRASASALQFCRVICSPSHAAANSIPPVIADGVFGAAGRARRDAVSARSLVLSAALKQNRQVFRYSSPSGPWYFG